MDFAGNLLIIDNNIERRKKIETIVTFLGLSWQSGEELDCLAYLDDSNDNTAVLVGEINKNSFSDLVSRYGKLPFIGIDVKEEYTSPNMMGTLSEPFNMESFSQQIRYCQSFFSFHPRNKNQDKSQTLLKLLVGQGSAIKEVRHLIEQVATTDANVLILGESGTGKEVVARSVHELSKRSKGPFVPINCGAIPGELLESELFGHEKGSFTGAISSRKGRFELAEGGTIFLDEIGDMPMPMQVKLLRVLQERYYERVGGNKPIKTNVRVIAATHRHLEEMIKEGKFREDLYYRLNVFPIETPPLRERTDDIPLLLQELISRHAIEHQVNIRFTQAAIDSLMKHNWSGNVRELSNLVERLMILHPNCIIDSVDLPIKYRYGDDAISASSKSAYENNSPIAERDALIAMFNDTPSSIGEVVAREKKELDEKNSVQDIINNKDFDVNEQEKETNIKEIGIIDETAFASVLPDEGINLKDMVADLEINLIKQALDKQNGVTARAADLLGMRRTTLVEKMKKYGIVAKEF